MRLSNSFPGMPLLAARQLETSRFGSRAEKRDQQGSLKIRLKFEESRQASSPSLCASVRAVPWADGAE